MVNNESTRWSAGGVNVTNAPTRPGDSSRLPVTRVIHEVDRTAAELAPIIQALEQLRTDQTHPLLITLTGAHGSGKTVAGRQIVAAAVARSLSPITLDAESLVQQAGTRNFQAQAALESIAAAAAAEVTDLHQDQPGIATLNEMAKRISQQLERDDSPRLVVLIDHAGASADTQALTRTLEQILFTRLEESKRRSYPALIIAASHQELRWTFLTRPVHAVALKPFTVRQTQEQLGSDETTAQKLLAATAGLPAANAWLWDQRDRAPQDDKTLFTQVFQVFVQPFLGDNPLLAEASRALALLKHGFNAAEFKAALQQISYLAGRYTEEGMPFYYGEIDRLYNLGIIHFNHQDGKYHLEAHLARLLALWNRYNVSPPDANANRTVVEQIYKETRGPGLRPVADTVATPAADRRGEPQERPPATPGVRSSGFPGLDRAYQRIYHGIYDAHIQSEIPDAREFVGRHKALQDLAGYLCRQPGYEADIVFVQGGAGSGKTELLRRFVQLARLAVEGMPGSNLIIPSPAHNIDLELSYENRLRSVREAIRLAIEDVLQRHPHSPEHEARVREAFAEYQRVQDKLREHRTELRKLNPIDEENRELKYLDRIQPLKTEITQRRGELTTTFEYACRTVARLEEVEAAEAWQSPVRQRILLVFDTFDYPVRSGLSALQFLSEIAAELVGDFCFLIACRPPIEAEKKDDYIRGDLRNYLPDDLRDQAAVLNLDDLDYRLTSKEIARYYKSRDWYAAAANTIFHYNTPDGRNIRLGRREELAEEMAEIVEEQRSLPVLLSLIEWYVGINNLSGSAESTDRLRTWDLMNSPATLRRLKEDVFGNELIRGLLTSVPGRDEPLSSPSLSALLLMSVIERGVEKRLLDWIEEPLFAICESTALNIWSAIRNKIAQEDKGVPRSTLVKPLGGGAARARQGGEADASPPEITAYKLHDYVSTLFKRYIPWWMNNSSNQDEDSRRFAVWRQREDVIGTVLAYYMLELGTPSRPPGPQEAAQGWPEEMREQYIRARASQVYYGLQLAAIRYDDETAGPPRRALDDLIDHDCQARILPQNVETISTTDLQQCLGIDPQHPVARRPLRAVATAELICAYLYGKVVWEIRYFGEFGFAETLLQEVRYYLRDQEDEQRRVKNLTLPLLPGGDETAAADFATARHYYYAALVYYSQQVLTGSYLDVVPWNSADWADIYALICKNGVQDDWVPIDSTEQPLGEQAEPTPLPLDPQAARPLYQQRYTWRLFRVRIGLPFPYYSHAYAAANDLLALRGRVTPADQAKWLLRMAQMLIHNPDIASRHTPREHLQEALDLLRTEKGLREQLRRVEVYNELGFLYRIISKIPEAIANYRSALALLKGMGSRSRKHPEYYLQQATAYNGLSYALAIEDHYDDAEAQWHLGFAGLKKLPDDDRTRAARGRAHSTLGEIYRFRGLDLLVSENSVRAFSYFMQANKEYDQAFKAFHAGALDEDVIWVNAVRQQRAINEYHLALAKNSLSAEELEKIMWALRYALAYCDAPRKLAAWRHLGIVSQKLGQYAGYEHYYQEAEKLYERAFAAAVRTKDAFNITRMALGLIQAVIRVNFSQTQLQVYPRYTAAQATRDAEQKYYAVIRANIDRLLMHELHDTYFHALIVTLAEISLSMSYIQAAMTKQGLERSENNESLVERLISHLRQFNAYRLTEQDLLSGTLSQLTEDVGQGRLDPYIAELLRACERSFSIGAWKGLQEAITLRHAQLNR